MPGEALAGFLQRAVIGRQAIGSERKRFANRQAPSLHFGRADIVIVIEDDIVISKFFFSAMRQLAAIALNNGNVGSFSAFGNPASNYAMQFLTRNRFMPMHHRWAHGVTRRHWEKVRPDFQRYLHLIEGEYRQRPHAKIADLILSFQNTKNISHISSHDGMRTALMLHHGEFSFMPPVSYAINIGKKGLHSYPAFYQEHREKFKGRHYFFPFQVTFSESALQSQMDRLINECIEFKYY